MPVIARDAVASDHLVYAWPLPIGPEEYEVACAEDELVVMCPSWLVGDRLGPGRHRWRTPDPMRPVSAYFVLTAPVEVAFDVITQFVIPATGQPVRLRASGSVQVRCLDAALLIAQFVGLPFDHVNDGVLRSVSRSIERMLARLLTRRVVMAGTPQAVTDPQMLPNIIEELVAYNPTAGADFGIELVRLGHLEVLADDGSRPWQQMQATNGRGRHHQATVPAPTVAPPAPVAESSLLETVRGTRPASATPPAARGQQPPLPSVLKPRAQTEPGADGRPSEASGEITPKPKSTTPGIAPIVPPADGTESRGKLPRHASAVEIPVMADDTPSGGMAMKGPGSGVVSGEIGAGSAPKPPLESTEKKTEPEPVQPEPSAHGSILGIGVSAIGSPSTRAPTDSASSEKKIAPGGRVLVPGPNGLMQSATVRQLLQGYYELEVGGSGETIWVPINNVVPE